MTKYVHFVISVNLENNEVQIDDDTYTAVFHNGGLYDSETQEWRIEDYDTEYFPALEILNSKCNLEKESYV